MRIKIAWKISPSFRCNPVMHDMLLYLFQTENYLEKCKFSVIKYSPARNKIIPLSYLFLLVLVYKYVCVHACICVYMYMCTYLYVCMCSFVCVCLCVMFVTQSFPFLLLGSGYLTDLQLLCLVRMAGLQGPGICLSPMSRISNSYQFLYFIFYNKHSAFMT